MNITNIVDNLLEGKPLSDLLTSPQESVLIGKRLMGVGCPSCNAQDTLTVRKVIEGDENFYTVVVSCSACEEPTEMEIVVKEGTEMSFEGDSLVFEGNTFEGISSPMMEGGIMNGNYLKFNSGVVGYITKTDKGENFISFTEPTEGTDFKPLNAKVTYKVISFRNNIARLISMVNDNSNGFPSGTIFYTDKKVLQDTAKLAKPRQNPSMSDRFAY